MTEDCVSPYSRAFELMRGKARGRTVYPQGQGQIRLARSTRLLVVRHASCDLPRSCPLFRRRSARGASSRVCDHRSGSAASCRKFCRKSGEFYPCSDCACGCASAEQCWRSCCCHSMAERMAWARVHGRPPPDYAIAAGAAGPDRSGVARRPDWRGEVAIAVLCSRVDGRCAGVLSCEESLLYDHHEQPSESKSNRVIGWKALNCQGHSANWLAAVPTLVSADSLQSQELPLVEWLGPAISEHCSSRQRRSGDSSSPVCIAFAICIRVSSSARKVARRF